MRRWLLWGAVVLIVAALLTYLVQNYLRDLVLAPLLNGLWILQIIISSIPRDVFWALFIIIALLIAIGSLPIPTFRKREPPPHTLKKLGRIEAWEERLAKAEREPYYRWQLAQQLRKLALETLAHDERLTAKELRQHLLDHQLTLPPEIEAYFQDSFKSFIQVSDAYEATPNGTPLDLDPARVVEFLENYYDLRTE